MKRIFTLVLSVIVSVTMFAQRPTATLNQVNDMLQGATLYVVLDNNPINDYNSEIRKAVEKNWTLTPFKFIHIDVLDSTKLQNPKNAFLVPVTTVFVEDKDSVKYLFLSLWIGGEYETLSDLPEVCTFPLCYDLSDEFEMTYKLPAIVAFFNKHVQAICKHKPKKLIQHEKEKEHLGENNLYGETRTNASVRRTVRNFCNKSIS